jgi:hypothetical protein
MSWILPDDHSNAITTTRSISLLLELCLDEKKPPLLQISKSSLAPSPIAISFENRISHLNLQYQIRLITPTFSIEYP